MLFDLNGRVALVTGSGQGVGAGIARLLAEQGAKVIVNDLHIDRAAATADTITNAGRTAIAVEFDVADWTERQLTTGRAIRVAGHDGTTETLRALGVDAASGALIVADATAVSGERPILVGEIVHVRLADPLPSPSEV